MVVEHSLLCLCRAEYKWGRRGVLRISCRWYKSSPSQHPWVDSLPRISLPPPPERALRVHKCQMTLEISVLCCVCYAQSLQSSLALCNSMDCRDQWIGFKSCYRSVYFLCCMGTGVSWITESAWIFEFFIASVSRSHLTQSFFFSLQYFIIFNLFFLLKSYF